MRVHRPGVRPAHITPGQVDRDLALGRAVAMGHG